MRREVERVKERRRRNEVEQEESSSEWGIEEGSSPLKKHPIPSPK